MTKFYKNCRYFVTTVPKQQQPGAGAFSPASAKKSGSGSTKLLVRKPGNDFPLLFCSQLEELRIQVETLKSELAAVKLGPVAASAEKDDGQPPQVSGQQEREMTEAVEVVKQRLEAEHSRKYEAAARQIQQVQAAQLDRLRGELTREHEKEVAILRQQLERRTANDESNLQSHKQKNQDSPQILSEVGAASEVEAEQLDVLSASGRAAKLLADLGRLEEDKARLLASQRMMKDLIADLVRHYSLRRESNFCFLLLYLVFMYFCYLPATY